MHFLTHSRWVLLINGNYLLWERRYTYRNIVYFSQNKVAKETPRNETSDNEVPYMPPQVQHKTSLVEVLKGMATIINGRTTKISKREKFCCIMGYVIAKRKHVSKDPNHVHYTWHMTLGHMLLSFRYHITHYTTKLFPNGFENARNGYKNARVSREPHGGDALLSWFQENPNVSRPPYALRVFRKDKDYHTIVHLPHEHAKPLNYPLKVKQYMNSC